MAWSELFHTRSSNWRKNFELVPSGSCSYGLVVERAYRDTLEVHLAQGGEGEGEHDVIGEHVLRGGSAFERAFEAAA